MHKPIILNNLSLYFPNKTCFENFSTQIQSGNRIAVIGNNGSGKSALLKIIKNEFPPSEGKILNNQNLSLGYVPQLIYEYGDLSGGEKFNKSLSAAIAQHPDVLILDEPTNHLDLRNRKSLITMLEYYRGTLIVVSHDIELLRSSINIFWHIDNGKINVFLGRFDDYRNEIFRKRQNLEDELNTLKKEKKENHKSLMKEQQRAAKSKQRGEKLVEQKRWIPAVGDAKQSTASGTTGNRSGSIADRRTNLNTRLSSLRIPEIIKPKFSLSAKDIGTKTIVSISGASAGYKDKHVLNDINISIRGSEHLVITGNNGSGKTTLFKAILDYPEIIKDGIWDVPKINDIGYLDQYYGDLEPEKTVFETISEIMQNKTHSEIRDFLNDFLFRKNEEINKKAVVLSGGEKARLCLAKISAKTPKLLLIDEITNNIDLETKEHITEVLKEYPGAMIIISHDSVFLEDLEISHFFNIQE